MSATLEAPNASSTTRFLDAALRYAELGYPVFPCSPGTKKPFKNSKGLLDATTDEATIMQWWEATPNANVAIRTDGMVVIDVDGRDNSWLADDLDKAIDLLAAPLSASPNGLHYMFRMPTGFDVRNSASKLAPNVDVRASGGYIVVAPSVVDGTAYSWPVESLDCSADELPELPKWLRDSLSKPKGQQSTRNDQPRAANPIPDGRRNSTLTSIAGLMRRAGMGYDEINAALQATNSTRCVPPLDRQEVEGIAKSVSKYLPDTATVIATEGLSDDDDLEPDTAPADPGPIPAKLLYVPGFIGDVMQYSMETAPYPNAVLAFGGALALQAFLASRKVREVGGSRPNLYLLALANSGTGKEHPRQVTQRILTEVGLGDRVANKLASFEGLEDLLYLKSAVLLQIDEIDALLQATKNSKDSRYEQIVKALTEFYTAAGTTYHLRTRANQEASRFIHQPAVNIFGTAIPSRVYESMTPTMLVDGFFSRLLIIEAGKRGEGQESIEKPLPQKILDVAQWWAGYPHERKPGELFEFNPTPRVVSHNADAAKLLAAFRKSADAEYDAAEARDDQVAMAMWSRANEKCRRLAVNYACSENHLNPIISADAAQWACDFATHQSRRMLYMASSHVTDNEFEAKQQKLLRMLRTWQSKNGDAFMRDRDIKRGLRGWTQRDHEEVRTALISQGRIEVENIVPNGAGRPTVGLRIRVAKAAA